jgi:hypothetical protein
MDVRHYFDEMHVIKNIYESLIGMLLNIQKKRRGQCKKIHNYNENLVNDAIMMS